MSTPIDPHLKRIIKAWPYLTDKQKDDYSKLLVWIAKREQKRRAASVKTRGGAPSNPHTGKGLLK